MPRANSSVHRHKRRRKILKQAKGYRGARSRRFKVAKDAVEKALQYAYRDRKRKKREFRRLWITRINAAARQHGMKYSRFIHALKEKDIKLNRKVLAELALNDPDGFKKVVEKVKA